MADCKDYSNNPAHNPEKLHSHDVICGRGGQSNTHPGNEWFRRLVRSNRELYLSCPKHTKLLVAKAIVQAVRQQDPPGRFMKLKELSLTHWLPVPYEQAVAKASQALREREKKDASRGGKTSRGKRKRRTACEENAEAEQRLLQKDQTEALGIAMETAKRVKNEGAQTMENISELTNATIQTTRAGLISQHQRMTMQGRMVAADPQQQQQQHHHQQHQHQHQHHHQQHQHHQHQQPQEGDGVLSSRTSNWWEMASPLNSFLEMQNKSGNSKNATPTNPLWQTTVTPPMVTVLEDNINIKNNNIKNIKNNNINNIKNNNDNGNDNGNDNTDDSNNRRLRFSNHTEETHYGIFQGANGSARGNEPQTMGRGIVNQVLLPARAIQSLHNEDTITPLPIETTMQSRQSTMFRFLSSLGLVSGSGRPKNDADPPDTDRTNTGSVLHKGPGLLLSRQRQPKSVSSEAPRLMGRRTVQQLRLEQQQQQQNSELQYEVPAPDGSMGRNLGRTTKPRGSNEQEVERFQQTNDLLSVHRTREGGDSLALAASPSPTKGLKAQVSDWLTFFHPTEEEPLGHVIDGNRNRDKSLDNNSTITIKPLSKNDVDDEGHTIPSPPKASNRNISSAFSDFFAPPMATMMSSISSLFGDSLVSPERVFAPGPSRRQRQRQRQRQNLQQQETKHQQQCTKGVITSTVRRVGWDALSGSFPLLGEKPQQRPSLLDDIEETPMEQRLRNANGQQ